MRVAIAGERHSAALPPRDLRDPVFH